MPSTTTDRLNGLTTSVAVKAPCKAAGTGLTLSGEQTVSGTACVAGDRVLNYGTGVDVGIWVVATGTWSRATDFDGARDAVKGTLVLVAPGTDDAQFFVVTTSGTISPGTTSITIEQMSSTAATLLLDLASTASASVGGGMIGVDRALSYASGTAGYEIKRIVNVPDPTGSEDYTIVQAAATALSAGDTLRFPQGKSYQLNSATPVVISVSGVTIDFNGSAVTAATPNSIPAFRLIPASLVSSGRLTGADYPSSWKNGATPLPMDSDFDTMMHEHTDASRLKSIVVKNARSTSGLNRTFLNAYSVDGLTFENCNIQPTGYSALRLHHCDNITAGASNYFGGTGTYLVFLLKCGTWNFAARFSSTTATRALSAKGVMHAVGTSIFSSFGSTYRACNSRFSGQILDGLDGVFWDSTPFWTEDAVGARGGTPIGFTSGTWYGKGSGLLVHGASISLASATPGTNGGQQGRAVWVSAPHKNVSIKSSSFYDAILFATGVQELTIADNDLYYTRGTGYAWEAQGDSTSSTDAFGYTIERNRIHSWIHVGTTVIACRVASSNGKFRGNQLINPDASTTSFVAWGGNFTGVSDLHFVDDNDIFYPGTPPTLGSFGSNNANGYESNTRRINTSTGAIAVSGIKSRDNAAGGGLIVTASDDSTGFAGVSFYDKAFSTLKGQFYWDAATDALIHYVSTAARTSLTSSAHKPVSDNSITSGASGARWSAVWSATGTIQTSDERQKQQISDIPDEWLDAWGDVKWSRFKLNDAVAQKGDAARWHIGLIAQQVIGAFAARGLDALALGIVCHDSWPDQFDDVRNEAGEPTGERVLMKPAGEMFSVRYDEAQAIEAAWLRRKLA